MSDLRAADFILWPEENLVAGPRRVVELSLVVVVFSAPFAAGTIVDRPVCGLTGEFERGLLTIGLHKAPVHEHIAPGVAILAAVVEIQCIQLASILGVILIASIGRLIVEIGIAFLLEITDFGFCDRNNLFRIIGHFCFLQIFSGLGGFLANEIFQRLRAGEDTQINISVNTIHSSFAGILPQIVGVFRLKSVLGGNLSIVGSPVRNPHNIAHANRLTGPLVALVDIEADFFAALCTQCFQECDTNLFSRLFILSLILDVGNVEFRSG